MRKLAFLSAAFALAAVSFSGCDESNPTEPADGSNGSADRMGSAKALTVGLFPGYLLTESTTGVPMVVLDDPGWPGGSEARAINDRGQVAGSCAIVAGEHAACLWTREGVSILPSTDAETGKLWGGAYGLNNRGQVVGGVGYYTSQPVLWDQSGMSVLEMYGDDGAARAINNRGQAVGSSGIVAWRQYAVLWKRGEMVQLGTVYDQWDTAPPDIFDASATDINNRGQVVGQETVYPVSGPPWTLTRAVMWHGDQTIDLGPDWTPLGINNRGQIAGISYPTTTVRAVVWDQGQIIELEAPCSDSFAWDINDRGQVAGTCRFGDDSGRAYLWEDSVGHDLGTLGGGSSSVAAINSRGMVAGTVSVEGRSVAVVWLTQFADF